MRKSDPHYDGEFSPHDPDELDALAFDEAFAAMPYENGLRGDEDMQINGPAHVHGAQPIRAPHNTANTQAAGRTTSVQGADEVSISAEADFLAQVHELPEIRQDRVDALRAQIADGSYDVDAKLDTAVDRLLDELA